MTSQIKRRSHHNSNSKGIICNSSSILLLVNSSHVLVQQMVMGTVLRRSLDHSFLLVKEQNISFE
jgi:hypothetical protein